MTRTLSPLVITAVGLVVLASSPPAARAQAPRPSPAIEPEAMSALEKMGTYLRTLNVFQVNATITTENVLDDGQKEQEQSTATLLAVRPNRLLLQVNGNLLKRTFFYDGKTFTLWAPLVKFYATAPAPGTIKELAAMLEDRYDIELPLVDLFRWGTDEAQTSAITAAEDLGPSTVDGTTCEQYAFRQDGADWQIWLQAGDYPLPRRLVITTTDDDARPQYTVDYVWSLAPSYDDDAFTFVVPSDAKRIQFSEVTPSQAISRK